MRTPTPPSKPRLAKDFLAAVLDTVIDGVISINESGTMLSVNSAALRIFNYREDELVGRNVTMLMPEPHRSAHARYIASFRNTGIAKVIGVGGRELTAVRADGSDFPIELAVTETIVDGVSIFVGVIRDITERRTAQKLSSELAGVAEVVVDALVVIDQSGTIQSWNPAATRIFGYQPSEVMGKNVKLLMPEPYHSEHDGYLRRFAVTREPRIIGSGREVTGRRKDGTLVPIDLAVSELRLDGTHRYVGLIRDISERKRRDEEREQLIDALKLTNQELDDFAYIASHDLKEPLRGLANNATFLEEDYRDILDEGGKSRLARMRYLCFRMEALINDLLYVSRLGRQELAIRDTDLNVLVQDIVQLMDAVLEDQHASIVVPRPLPHYECDHVRVQELFRNLITNAVITNVFQNLIGNALNYGDKALTRIEVSCKTEEFHHVFSVEDNGAGIDPRHTHKLFQPFKRLNPKATRGSGLGLALCKKIVENHQGSIWVESSLGHGTKVCFTLPTLAPSAELREQTEPPVLSASEPAPDRELAHVLLVEDNEADVVLTQVLLQETDGLQFHIHSASNGERALQWLLNTTHPKIDLILLDINMPVMDGFAFLKALRGEPLHAHIPVIMCSTSEEPGDLTKARAFGVAAYVTKPVRLEQLEEPLREVRSLAINRALGTPRLERRKACPDC